MFHYHLTHRVSWAGVFAGLVVGIVAFGAMIALGVIITSIIGLDLAGTGIVGAIWSFISVFASAYIAGMAAMSVSKGSMVGVDGYTTLGLVSDNDDASIVGILTGCLIVIATSYMAFSGLSAIVTGAGQVAGGAAKLAGGAIATTAGVAITTTDADEVNNIVNNVDQADIEKFIAANVDDLNQAQVRASAQIVQEIVANTKSQVSNENLYNVDAIKAYAEGRLNEIEAVMLSPELISRLEAKGLTTAQAQEVQNKLKQYIAEARQKYNQAVYKIEQTLDKAETVTRATTSSAGVLWLLTAFLTVLASVLGAKCIIDKRFNHVDHVNHKEHKRK